MAPRTTDDELDDDAPRGRVLSRREVLGLFAGLGGAALLVACDNGLNTVQPTSTAAPEPTQPSPPTTQPTGAPINTALTAEGATAVAATPAEASPTAEAAVAPDCVVRPEQTEGPYFRDEKLNRADIRSDPDSGAVKAGAPLVLAFMVSKVASGACSPLAGAQVDVWHCDAQGIYSDTSDPNWGSTVGQKFLRGYQVTDATGKAQFTTIYPGWYGGRTVHIHFKIRTTGTNSQNYEFTSQLYFDDNLTDQVHAQQPYASKGQRTMRNNGDGIYRNGGSQLMLPVAKSGNGYAGTFNIALDLSDTQAGQPDSNGQGRPGGPPRRP